MNTKIHAICDSQGCQVNLFVSAGEVSDDIRARALMGSLSKVGWLLGNREYDAEWFREALKDSGLLPLNPRSKVAQGRDPIRQASISTPQQDRDHFGQMEGLAAHSNKMLPLSAMLCIGCRQWMPKGLFLRNRSHGTLHLLAMSPEPISSTDIVSVKIFT